MNEQYEVVKNILVNLIAQIKSLLVNWIFAGCTIVLVQVKLTDLFSTWTKLHGDRKLVL